MLLRRLRLAVPLAVLVAAVTFVILYMPVVPKQAAPPPAARKRLPTGPYNQSNCWCQKPVTMLETESFQGIGKISETNGRQCVLAFSAYFDRRNRTVAIIADGDMTCYESVRIGCFLWYSGFDGYYASVLTLDYVTTTVPGETPRIGVVYYCETPAEIEEMPYAVSFLRSDDNCSGESSCPAMAVTHPKPQTYQFTVCVPTIFGSPSLESLLQFVEMHRLLGAEKFYFYNESIPESWDAALQLYRRMGIIQIVQWHSVYPDIVLYHNQQIMQDDCMYRNMYQTRYVAQMDIDEVLMTQNQMNWSTVVKRMEKADTAVFMFLNQFYFEDEYFECDLNLKESRSSLNTQDMPISYFRRLVYDNTSWGPNDRSKLMYRPEKLQQVCTHQGVPLEGFKTVILEREVGVVQHYRVPQYLSAMRAARVLDHNICLYKQRLTGAIRSILDLILQEQRKHSSK